MSLDLEAFKAVWGYYPRIAANSFTSGSKPTEKPMQIPEPAKPTYAEKFRQARDEADRMRWSALNNIADDERVLQRYTVQFERYPIIVIDRDHNHRFDSAYGIRLTEHFGALCKYNGWLHVPVVRYLRYWDMVVPNNRRTPKLVSGLLVIANSNNTGVSVVVNPRSYSLRFTDGELLKAWINQCRRDHLYKMIVGFYPKGELSDDDIEI